MRTLNEVIAESILTKQRLLERDDVMAAAQQVVTVLVRTYRAGGRLYLCGNGGSAADAQHFAAELTGHFIFDRPPLAAEVLHGNASHMTCVANDYDWDQVFARAVGGSAREGDVLVCLSTSGDSSNVLRAAETARDLGVLVVGFTGSSGGRLKALSDICVCVPSDDTGRIQESHINLIHGISEQVEHLMFADQAAAHGRSVPNPREARARSRVSQRAPEVSGSVDAVDLADIVRARTDRRWCLFVDRDGVINERVAGDYVRTWSEFRFLPDVLDALRTLSGWAPAIVVVTNQQGVGKSLMSAAELADIHRRMRDAVADAGGRIDDVLVCPHLATAGCRCRKPAPGLALSWLAAHPDVDPGLSVMVGDSDSDVAMATHLAAATGGCAAVGIGPEVAGSTGRLSFASLADLAAPIAAAAS